MFYIFDDSRKKQKYRFIFLFFLNGWRSVRDEGIRNENSKKDEELNKWKQAERERAEERKRERDRQIKGGSELQSEKNNEQKSASHCWDPPSHLPTSLLQVTQCEMENRATDTVVHRVVNNHQVRNSEGDLTLRLSMQGSALGFVI